MSIPRPLMPSLTLATYPVEAAAGREVSPSDAELQAVLEVGRTRLSQIFNGIRRAGLLSVRKQGRTRLFKLSDVASTELGMI